MVLKDWLLLFKMALDGISREKGLFLLTENQRLISFKDIRVEANTEYPQWSDGLASNLLLLQGRRA